MVTAKNTMLVSQLIKTNPQLGSALKAGDLVEGKVLTKTPRALFLDLGKHGTGIVRGAELSNSRNQIKELAPGTTVTAKVVEALNDDGYVELSVSEAGKQKAWEEIKELKEKDEPIAVKIAGANYGGLISKIGDVKAFLPVSQLSSDHYPRVGDADKRKILEELKKFVGEELSVKILDFAPKTGKLILSEREVSDQNLKTLLARYEAGNVIEGTVSGIADFGAFIRFADTPEIEGLAHVSEISHRLIDNPKEVLKVGEPVKAKIVEIKDGRVSLSLKSLQENPWEKADKKYQAGSVVKGTVAKFNPYGAFIDLDTEIQGTIHVSEFGGVEEMKNKLAVGKTYGFLINAVKPDEKRIILKMAK